MRAGLPAWCGAISLILVAAPGPLRAQERVPSVVPSESGAGPVLEAIVKEALEHNLSLAQERLLEARAVARMDEARGRSRPSLNLNSRYSEQSGAMDLGRFVNPANAALNQLLGEDRFPTDLSATLPFRHQSSVRLVQPVFNQRIRAGLAVAREGLEGQRAQRRAAARALAAEAQTAFLNVALARSLRRVWESTLPLVEESERVSQRLVDAGNATPDAVFRARAERSEVEQKLQEAREQEDTGSRAFNQLLQRPLDTPVETLAESEIRFPISLTEEEAVARALQGREELDGLEAGIRASAAGVRVVTASWFPEVSLALDYGFQGRDIALGRDQEFSAVSIVVSWSLFNGGQDAARRDAAQAELRRLRLRRQEVEDLIRLDVRQAYAGAVVARDAIATAEARLASARRGFQLVRRRYEEGLATPIEFLDARTELTNAEINRTVTVYRYAIRWVDLERAAALREMEPMEDSSWN